VVHILNFQRDLVVWFIHIELIIVSQAQWIELKYIYEGSSKSFRTSIFSWETVMAGGVVIGRV
jgi:hypothetical protein